MIHAISPRSNMRTDPILHVVPHWTYATVCTAKPPRSFPGFGRKSSGLRKARIGERAGPVSHSYGAMTQQTRDIDVLILGAGINGAGLFRDLCEQGLTVAIVDKADFGSGTSAAPSRLIHGGIKYLETGELGLVAQSTLERNLLLRNAPHCVEPLPTFIPSFSLMKGAFAALRTLLGSTTAPRSRGAVLIKIGLALYDLYGARHRVMPRHQFFFRRKAIEEMPAITPRIVAGGIYYDAKISRPERLVWELVRDGLDASPHSRAMNVTTLLGQEA